MDWPALGNDPNIEANMDYMANYSDMFRRMCKWHDNQWLICGGTKDGSDRENKHGIVLGHAYTVLDLRAGVAGTKFDLVQVRNPWGSGEFEGGQWDDHGSMWEQYPEVKAAIQPEDNDDGIFWMSKEEFFKYFRTVYVCGMKMKDFIDGKTPDASQASGGLHMVHR